jgi:two-component system response regulator HydG
MADPAPADNGAARAGRGTFRAFAASKIGSAGTDRQGVTLDKPGYLANACTELAPSGRRRRAAMSGNRLALVAEDQRCASAIQAHLQHTLGQSPLLCRFDTIRDHLGRDTDGLLLLAAVTPGDADAVLRLVQEIYLQKLPPVILLIEVDCAGGGPYAVLEPYVAERLRWPDEAEHLSSWVSARLRRVHGFLDSGEEALPEVLARRLLSMTPSLLPLVERIALVASHDVTVLLTGETGTGKTFLARLMHDYSPRRQHPFVVVPCGAQPANLIGSAFFGHVRGAFTGADRAAVGKFAAAGEGTLLLDEIDVLGVEQQAALLRVIETGEFEPVGSNATQMCRARIIVTSNRDLEEEVAEGRLREDLYYRLNVMSFHLPPLRERVIDIAPLVRGMAARFNTKFRKGLFDIHPETMAVLEAFPWPGNLRQLENCVQQAVLVSSGPELLPAHLPQEVRKHAAAGKAGPSPESLQHGRELGERLAIERALAKNNNSRTRTARELGISRVTLYKKMRSYGLLDTPEGHKRKRHEDPAD